MWRDLILRLNYFMSLHSAIWHEEKWWVFEAGVWVVSLSGWNNQLWCCVIVFLRSAWLWLSGRWMNGQRELPQHTETLCDILQSAVKWDGEKFWTLGLVMRHCGAKIVPFYPISNFVKPLPLLIIFDKRIREWICNKPAPELPTSPDSSSYITLWNVAYVLLFTQYYLLQHSEVLLLALL